MLVNNQLSGWMQRVASKLAELADDFDGAQKIQGNSLVDQFRYISDRVSGYLK